MYCPEKLKLNKFKEVALPKNKDYANRLGLHDMPSGAYTGEEEAVNMETRKVENIATAQENLYEQGVHYNRQKNGSE